MSDYPELDRIEADDVADRRAHARGLAEGLRQLDQQIPPSWPNAEACGCCITEQSYRLRQHRPGTNKPSKVRRYCPKCDEPGGETLCDLGPGFVELCPWREDGIHCEHWWDGDEPCCGCGDDIAVDDGMDDAA